MDKRPHKHHASAGFTLLEVMIAVAIFAVCAAILLKQSGLSARQSGYLAEKTQALWIAENTLASLRLKPRWPDTGQTLKTVTQSDRDWEVTTFTTATSHPNLRRVKVTVSPVNSDNPERPGAATTLTGYLGKY